MGLLSTYDPTATPYQYRDGLQSYGLLGAAAGLLGSSGATRLPTTWGQALGSGIQGGMAGLQQGQKAQVGAQALQTAQMQNQLQSAIQPLRIDQLKALTAQGVNGAASPGGYGPSDALRDMRLAQANGDGRGYAAASTALQSMLKNGQQYGDGFSVQPIPGAPQSQATLTGANAGATAGVDVAKQWALLAPEAQKALTAAGIDVNKAWAMPQTFAPGQTIGSPAGMVGGQPGGMQAPPGMPQQQGQQPGNSGQAAGLDPATPFVMGQEKFVPQAYQDGKGLAVGYGSTATSPNQMVTQGQAQAMLQTDLARGRGGVQAAAASAGITLSPQQETALTSFNQNTGKAAEVLQAAQGDPTKIPALMQSYNQADGQVKNGLVTRRAAEAAMFANGAQQQPQQISGPMPGTATVPDNTEQKADATRMAELPKDVINSAREGSTALQRIGQAQQAIRAATAAGIPPGKFGPALGQAAAAAKSLGIDTSMLNISPTAPGYEQAANEALTQVSGEILKRMFPQRITNADVNIFGSKLANYGMDPTAINTVLGVAQKQAQYDVDRSDSMLGWKDQHNGSLKGWERSFYKSNGYGPQISDIFQGTPSAGAGAARAPASQGQSASPSPQQTAPQQPAATSNATPNPAAAAYLKANPGLAAQFDAKYGSGASRAILGQ